MTNRIFSQVVADASFRLADCINNLPAQTTPYALSLIRGAIQDLAELQERGMTPGPMPVNTDILADLHECTKLMNSVLMSSVNGMVFRQHHAGKTLWAALDKLNMVRLQVELEPISDLKAKSPRSQSATYPTDWAGQDEMQRSVLALKAFLIELIQQQQQRMNGGRPYPFISITDLTQFGHTLDQVIDGWAPGTSTAVDPCMAIVDDEQLREQLVHYKSYFEAWKTDSEAPYPEPPVPLGYNALAGLIHSFDEVLNGKLRVERRAATLEQTEPSLVLHEMEIWEVREDPTGGTVLVQDDFQRAGVDLETDTFPLTIEAISYSRLFEDKLFAFIATDCPLMLANQDRIRQESLKRWRKCLTALRGMHGLTNADEIYRDWLKFLEEVKQASGQLQEILVQDIPVFKPA